MVALAVGVIIGCGPNDYKNTSVTVSGNITNPNSTLVKIENSEKTFKTRLDSEGEFSMTFEINKPGFFKFFNEENAPMFLRPGDRLNLTLDTGQFDETLTYSGRGASINNYLIKKFLVFEKSFYIKEAELFSQSQGQFIHTIDSLFADVRRLLSDAVSSEKGNTREFQTAEEIRLFYLKASFLLRYPLEYQIQTGKEAENPKETYYSFLKKIDLNDSSQIEIDEYREVLKSIVNKKTADELRRKGFNQLDDDHYAAMQVDMILKHFQDEEIKDYLIYNTAWWQIQKGNVDELLFKKISDLISNKKMVSALTKMFQKMSHLTKGNPAPNFSCLDMEGKTVHLTDFKGKPVYIDVWTTVCDPCIKEIPHVDKLRDEFKDIAFISISIDNKKDQWKQFIKKNKSRGIQLYAEGGWDSKFAVDYYIRYTPTYILIDREGKFINLRARKPTENIRSVLKKLKMN